MIGDSSPQLNILPERIEQLNLRILLAEDDKSVQWVTALSLERMGCVVETVANGQQLVDRLNAKPGEFDLVITDNRMPEMTGMEALAHLRADERFKQLPVVVYSGDMGSQIGTIKELTAVYLAKPFSRAELTEALKRAQRETSKLGEKT